MPLTLQLLPGEFAVCRLAPAAALPAWAAAGDQFVSITRTTDELSIACPAALVPAGVPHERDWRVLKIKGPFDFGAVGILASVVGPLAQAQVSSLAIATFDTDYVFVKRVTLEAAIATLRAAGHTVAA